VHHDSLDKYAASSSPVHRLDARAKLLSTLAYTALAVSESRTQLAVLPVYILPPVAVILMSGVPLRFVARRVIAVSPFALVFAAITLIAEPEPAVLRLGDVTVMTRVGAITGSVIVLKFLVSVLSLIALAATTPMTKLAGAMSSLGLPNALAMQVAMLYRYLFVVVDEFERRRRAAAARTVGRLALSVRVRSAGSHLGSLFLRSLERAERVAAAMAVRGFDGTVPRASAPRLRVADVLFACAAVGVACLLRFRNQLMEG
jgi:cobalt/nickel transport system permease protein